jgi:hypothetical protein
VVNVGDGFTTPVVGVLDYGFGNFKLNVTAPLARVDGGLQRETTRAPADWELVVGTYNVENLDPGDGGAFARHAQLIVDHLRAPDLLAIEEVQDNDGATNSSVTDASVTWGLLVDAIVAAGGRRTSTGRSTQWTTRTAVSRVATSGSGSCSAATVASASSTAPAAPRPPRPPWSTPLRDRGCRSAPGGSPPGPGVHRHPQVAGR